MGKGGVQGAVSFPDHIETWHEGLMGDFTTPLPNQIDDWVRTGMSYTDEYNPYYVSGTTVSNAVTKSFSDPRALLAPTTTNALLKDLYTRLDTLRTDIATELDDADNPGAEYGAIVDDVVSELASAWSALTVAAQTAAVKTNSRQYVADILKAGFTPAGVEQGDILAEVANVVAKVDTAGVINDITTATEYSTAKNQADTLVTAALAAAATGLDVDGDWATFAATVMASVDGGGFLGSLTLATIISDAMTSVSSTMSTILAALDSGVTPTTDFASYVTQALAQADTLNVLKTVDTATIITAAIAGAGTEVDAAVAKALAKIDASVIQDMLDAYADANEEQHSRAVRRFTGYMSDINAVQSSAFILGMSSMHTQKSRDSARHGGDIQREWLMQLMQGHFSAYAHEVSERLRVALAEKEARDRFMLASIQSQLTLVAQHHQTEIAQLDAFMRNFIAQMQTRLEGESLNVTVREQAMIEHVRMVMQAYIGDIGFKDNLSRSYIAAFSTALEGALNVANVNKGSRERFLSEWQANLGETLRHTTAHKAAYEMHAQDLERDFFSSYLNEDLNKRNREFDNNQGLLRIGIQHASNAHFQRLQLRHATDSLMQEIFFRDVAAYADYEGGNIDLFAKFIEHPWRMAAHGANLLAAPAGMTAPLPEGPTRLAAGLSGALGGAASGAGIGFSVGGPVGAAIGAGIGGLLGGVGGAASV